MGFLSKLFGRKKDEEKKEPLKIAEVEIDEILEKNEEISEEVKEKKETVQERTCISIGFLNSEPFLKQIIGSSTLSKRKIYRKNRP